VNLLAPGCEYLDPATGLACGEPAHVVEIAVEVITDEDVDNGVEVRYFGHLCGEHERLVAAEGWAEPA
jgi:hypothetical protein